MKYDERGYRGVLITKHAEARAIERLSMNFDKIKVLAAESLENGVDILHDESTRAEFLPSAKRHDCDGMYSHEGIVFVFKGNRLVTVYPLNWFGRWPESA